MGNNQTNVIRNYLHHLQNWPGHPPPFFCQQKFEDAVKNILQVWAGLLDYFISLLSTLTSNKQH